MRAVDGVVGMAAMGAMGMSENALVVTEAGAESEPAASEARPWHGSDNPFEALWQHFTAEIAALRDRLGDRAEGDPKPSVEAVPDA